MDLVIENVCKTYGENEVLNDVSVQVGSGNICALLGPSGSGKSTLLNVIGGVESFEKGRIKFGDVDITNMNENELSIYRRKYLGFVFQFYNLIPNLTVRENIEVAMELSKKPLELEPLLETLGLTEHQNKFPNQLSGGQQQRCAIGRALVKNPSLLLCDEPTGALDSKTAKDILELIEQINVKYGTTIIIVTHNESIVSIANQIVKLHDGKITSDEVNENIIPAKEIEL